MKKLINLIKWNWKQRKQFQCNCSPNVWYIIRPNSNSCQWCNKPLTKIRNNNIITIIYNLFIKKHMKNLSPKQVANKLMKEAQKRQAAVRVVKQVLAAYKEFHKYIAEKKKNLPMKGVATKALHTILGTKVKQKAKECNHCHTKTNNRKSLCPDCIKIPVCKDCTIMMGYWNEDKTKLIYNPYNEPSLLDPTICKGCYLIKHNND